MTDLERAREILSLYPMVTAQYVIAEALAAARDDALEEAALVCEGGYTTGSTHSTPEAVAAAIRALKDKR